MTKDSWGGKSVSEDPEKIEGGSFKNVLGVVLSGMGGQENIIDSVFCRVTWIWKACLKVPDLVLVDGKQGFKDSYRLHFVSVLHEVMVHSNLLPRWLVMTSQWWHHGGIPLECLECQKYLTCYVIMTSSANEKRLILRYLRIFLKSNITCGS